MVGVDVGDHHAPHVGDGGAGDPQTVGQRLEGVVGVPAGVDEVDPPVGLEGVDEDVAQRVVGDGDGDAPQPRPHPLDRREGSGSHLVSLA